MNCKTSTCVSGIVAALATGLVLLPFGTFLPIDYDRMIAAAFLPLVFASLGTKWARPQQGAQFEIIVLWLLGLVTIAALFQSQHIAVSLVAAASGVCVWSTGILTYKVSEKPVNAEWILAGLALGGAAGSIYVMLTWQLAETEPKSFPLYFHPRLFGMHAAAATWAGIAWLYNNPKKGFVRPVQWGAAAFACAGLFWSGGRSPLLMIIASSVAFLAISSREQRRPLFKILFTIAMGGMLISLACWTANPALGWWNAFLRTSEASTASELTSTRTEIWQSVWNSFLQSPWLGHGSDSYRFIQPRMDGHQPHNWMLQWLQETGIGGMLLFALLLGRRIWLGLTIKVSESRDRWTQAAACGLLGCCIGGLFDGFFYHAQIYLAGAVFAGLIYTPKNSTPNTAREALLFRVGHAVVLLSAFFIITLHGILVVAFSQSKTPPSPTSFTAGLARGFPSWNYGLERWLEKWAQTDPALALEWSDWACEYGSQPGYSHYYSAVLHLRAGQPEAAKERLEAGIKAAHRTMRPHLEQLLSQIESLQTPNKPTQSQK